jgi:dipeptidyl-peptidase-4
MKLNKYDAITGAFIKTLFIETHAKYVEPQHPVTFIKNSPRFFIWQSARDGHNHLYLYEQNGRFVRQLTTGDFEVTELMGFNDKGTKAYYMATANSGLERQCYSVEIESGKTVPVTRNAGVHQVVFSEDGKYFLDTYSNTNTPRKTILMNDEGLEKSVILHAQNPLMDYKTCNIRLFQIPAADKATKLNCRMFYPPNFDSTKKYPTIVYVYGGPHVQLVTNSWLGGSDMWLYYMAQQGYVVFTMDNRGSANRGMEFEQSTFRNLEKAEREDQMEGVSFLKKQKYIDATRLGVFGWSFGGSMSISLMTRTDAFKVGVSGGPVIDWRWYEIMYTERYMDKPDENPEGY